MSAPEVPALPILRGERVFLRAAERTDVPTFVRWFNDSVTTSFVTMRAPMSLAMEEQWFDQMLQAQGKDRYHFVICMLDGGAAIGTLGLFDVDHVNGSAGIGITIGEKELWGRGYGTDAMNALLDFGFGQLRLERMWLEVYDFNERARRSYEKSGFVLEGVKRHAMFKFGRFIDVQLMAILRSEWQALGHVRSWDRAVDGPKLGERHQRDDD
jgi:RimJ/RimL family protein N-acetyltransferase